jgi:hypothetical protein
LLFHAGAIAVALAAFEMLITLAIVLNAYIGGREERHRRWQGWALTIGFVIIAIGLALLLRHRPIALIAALIPLTCAFLIVTAGTTRGGWKWHWGEKD